MIDSEVSQSQNEQVIHGLTHCPGWQLKSHLHDKQVVHGLAQLGGSASQISWTRGGRRGHQMRHRAGDGLFVVINQLQKSFFSPGLALNQVLHHRGGLALASHRGVVLFRGQTALRLGLACSLNYNSASVHVLIVFCHLQPQFAHSPCLYLTQRRLRET